MNRLDWKNTAIAPAILACAAALFCVPSTTLGQPTGEDTLEALELTLEQVESAEATEDTIEALELTLEEVEGAEDTLEALELTLDEVEDAEEDAAEQAAVDSLPPISTMPELKQFVEAEYPSELQKQGLEGVVGLDLLVSDSGTVDSVAVVEGVHPLFDSAAAAAARDFRFSPALVDTTPVPVLLRFEYRFSLQQVVDKITEYVNFSGALRERGTRKPVADALVVVRFLDTLADTALDVPFSTYLNHIGGFEGQYREEDRLVTVTDAEGKFQFSSLPVGPIEVTAPAVGYQPFYERETINRSEAVEVTYWVERVNYSDYEVVVYGKVEKKEVSRQQLKLSEIKKIPGVGGDAVKVVQALPGVARPTFGSAEIVVRGAPTSNSKFLVDGIEIPQGLIFHFGGITSTYNADALESIDFYPGGFGTRYGGVLGGVVELTGRHAKTDRWHVSAGGDLVDGALYAEGPVGDKVSMIGQVRRSFIGDLINAVAGSYATGSVLTVAPFYWDYLVRTDFDISKKHHAFLTVWGVKDETKLVSTEVRGGSPDVDDATDALHMKTYFHLGIAGHDWKINDAWTNTLRYSLGYVAYEFSAFAFFKTESDYVQSYLRDQLTFSRSKKLTVNLGLDVQLAPVDYIIHIPAGGNKIERDTTEDMLYGVAGVYLNCEWRPWENLLIIPGLRYDYFPELVYDGGIVPEYWDYEFDNSGRWSAEPSARLTVRYEYIKRQAVKFAMGNYSQTPQPLGQALHPRWGNPSLSVSRAAHYVLGWEWRITDLISANVEGYINRQWDVAERTGESPPFDDNGKRRMKGIELMLRHDQGGPFFGWLAYSLSKSEYYDYDEQRWIRTGKDQTHNLILVAYTGLPKHWGAGVRLQFTTGDPYDPIIGSYYDVDLHAYVPEYGPKNSERLPPTLQLDLRIDRRFVFRKWQLTAYVSFFNINYFLNESPQAVVPNFSYPYNAETDVTYQTLVPQYSLPSIGLKAEF